MSKLYYQIVKTPIGSFQIIASDKGLCAVELLKPTQAQLLKRRLKSWRPGAELIEKETPAIRAARRWLDQYFKGDFRSLSLPELDLLGTDFERAVWKAMLAIRAGKTLSYGELAKKIGRPKAARAVGAASRKNSVGLIVPCHRVIGSNGTLVGYGGGLDRKQWLLAHEQKDISLA